MTTKHKLGNGITTNYINNVLSTLPYFLGTFPINKHPNPKKIKGNFCMIVNTAKHNELGEHWIAVMRYKKCLKISDSLTTFYNTRNVLKKIKNASLVRNYPIQAIDTETCGFFCIHDVLLFHLNLKKIKNTNKCFKKRNLYLNDEICISNIEKMLTLLK